MTSETDGPVFFYLSHGKEIVEILQTLIASVLKYKIKKNLFDSFFTFAFCCCCLGFSTRTRSLLCGSNISELVFIVDTDVVSCSGLLLSRSSKLRGTFS